MKSLPEREITSEEEAEFLAMSQLHRDLYSKFGFNKFDFVICADQDKMYVRFFERSRLHLTKSATKYIQERGFTIEFIGI